MPATPTHTVQRISKPADDNPWARRVSIRNGIVPRALMLGFPLFLLSAASCVDRPAVQHTPDAPEPAAERLVEPTANLAGPRIVDFAPGIRIDYRVPQVEVDAEVILRRGELELFAYSRAPVPKEHETILLLDVSPEAIYQALGLIGLTPGKPVRYLPETQTIQLPSGDPVDVSVRYESDGETVEASACDWMLDLRKGRPMEKTHWLFTGSRRLDSGTFYANFEGTVVTVVDFGSALLALPSPHSSSNAQLWLGANTEAIPPVGTKVTLILSPAVKP